MSELARTLFNLVYIIIHATSVSFFITVKQQMIIVNIQV